MYSCIDFQVCFRSEQYTISIGEKVSSVCRLNNFESTSHEENVLLSYCSGGMCKTPPPSDVCYHVLQTQSNMLNFDLLVSRPNNNNHHREAKIYVFNVTGEASLNVLCTYTQMDRMVVLNNTLRIEFVLSCELHVY